MGTKLFLIISTLIFIPLTSYSNDILLHEESYHSVNSLIGKELLKQLRLQPGVLRAQAHHCHKAGTNKDPRYNQYRCGEYPVGRVLNGHTKRLLEVKIPKVRKNISGANIEVSGFSIPILMDRRQKAGYIKLPWLDTKRTQNVKATHRYDKNLFVRHIPRGDAHYMSGCHVLPGTRIYTPDRTIVVKATKKIFWFIKAKVKVTSRINLGGYKFDNINNCGVFRATLPIASFAEIRKTRPKIDLLRLVRPQVKNGKFSGLNIKRVKVSGNLVYRIIKFVGKIFGYNFDQMISSALKSEIRKAYKQYSKTYTFKNISVADIRSGAWASKLFEGLVGNEVKINKTVHKAVKESLKVRKPDSNHHFQVSLDKQCRGLVDRLIKGGHLNGLGRHQAYQFCRKVAFDIKLIPFYNNPAYGKKGCYSKYASTFHFHNKGRLKWWAKGCKLQAKAIVNTAYDEFIDYSLLGDVRNCLVESAKRKRPSAACDKAIIKLVDVINNIPLSDLRAWVRRGEDRGGLPEEFLLMRKDL